MSFATPTFLWFFMPATLAVYWVLPRSARNGVLAFASLVFYTWGGHAFVFLLLGYCLVDWLVALWMQRSRRPKFVLALGVTFNLGVLAYFKYMNFFLLNANHLLGTHFTLATILLPLGISFFIFQKIAYLAVAGDDRKLMITPLSGGPQLAMKVGAIELRGVRWLDDGHLLVDTQGPTYHSEK